MTVSSDSSAAGPRSGRKPKLDEQQLERLAQLMRSLPEGSGHAKSQWTCQLASNLILQEFGVSYHPGHVWRILRRLRRN